jgi:two-component system, chemotaxis family, response regulator Rcp1
MGNKQVNVLLVEDNPADQLLAKEIIYTAYPGALIKVVEDGEKAIEVIELCSEQDSPDIVFLDLNLPRINGHDVLEYIKKKNSRIQVIVFTGSTSENDMARARKSDIIDYIIKPIGMKEMEATILRVRTHIESISIL